VQPDRADATTPQLRQQFDVVVKHCEVPLVRVMINTLSAERGRWSLDRVRQPVSGAREVDRRTGSSTRCATAVSSSSCPATCTGQPTPPAATFPDLLALAYARGGASVVLSQPRYERVDASREAVTPRPVEDRVGSRENDLADVCPGCAEFVGEGVA